MTLKKLVRRIARKIDLIDLRFLREMGALLLALVVIVMMTGLPSFEQNDPIEIKMGREYRACLIEAKRLWDADLVSGSLRHRRFRDEEGDALACRDRVINAVR